MATIKLRMFKFSLRIMSVTVPLVFVLILPIFQASGETIAKSWGDPEITTVDQYSYSFNGRGEYTFLETENRSFQIQTRMDYVIKGNTDSTMFVAFVLYDKTGGDSVTVTSRNETLHLFQNDGTPWIRNCSQPGQSQGKKFQWFCTPNGFVIHPLQRIGIQMIRFNGGKFLKIEILGKHITGMRGLAGNLVNGSYVSNNGSMYKSTTATEEQLYYYGESFRIKSENESNFNYTITGGSFTYWNKGHKPPRFLDKLAKEGNFSAIFLNYTNAAIRKVIETCMNSWDNSTNIQCLLVIAKTKDVKQGEYIMDISEKDHMEYMLLHNKPPRFVNDTSTFLNVSYGSTEVLDLKKFVRDDFTSPEKIQYRVFTNLTELQLVNGVFNWTVGKELRYQDFSLEFMLNDTFGFTTIREMIIYYCGCEQLSQCDFSSYNKNSSDKVKKASCKCPLYTSGLYCEIEEDPCDDFFCYTACNKSLSRTLLSWPCDDCPEGTLNRFVSYNQTCDSSVDEDFAFVKCTDSTWDIELDMNKLRRKYPGICPNDIFLGESKCQGKQEGSLLNFKYDLHRCKTTDEVSGITHIYNNKLFYVIFDPIIPFLIRRHIWTFTVECDVIRGGTGTSHLHHGIEMHHATYVNHFNVSVQLFSDPKFQNPIVRDGGTINIGDDVYVKVTTDIADWNTKMRLHTCFTKPYVNASSDKDVMLLSNGCEVDRNTHIISQSTHETSFVFRDFEYLTNDEGLDIFCNATFCDSRDFTPECSQSCYSGPPIIG